MRCRGARARFDGALASELALEEALAFEAHLAGCARCADAYARLAALEEAVRGSEEPLVSDAMLDAAWATIASRLDAPASPPESDGAAGANALGSDEVCAEPEPLALAPAQRRGRLVVLAALAAAVLLAVLWPWRGESIQETKRPSATRVATGISDPNVAASSPLESGEAETESLERAARGIGSALRASFGDGTGSAERLARFEELVQPYGDWPVARIATESLQAADSELARGAAVYLGLTETRGAVVELERALWRDDVRAAVARALARIGDPAVPVLARGLAERRLRSTSLEALGRIATASAADAVEDALADVLRGPTAREETPEFLDTLAEMGDAGLPALARIAGVLGADEREALLAALGEHTYSANAVERALRSRALRGDDRLALDLALALGGPAGLRFVRESARVSQSRAAALTTLARWPAEEALGALLFLDEAGALAESELEDTLRALCDHDPDGVRLAVDALLASADSPTLERALGLLVACRAPGAGAALVDLASSPALSPTSRPLAALAAGRVGGEAEGLALLDAARRLGAVDRRLRAAFLVGIHRALGPAAAAEALQAAPPSTVRRVLAVLDGGTDLADSILLFRVARALNGAPAAHGPSTSSSS